MLFNRIPSPQTFDFFIEGEVETATVRWNKQAKRIIIHIDPYSGAVLITLPKGAKIAEAKKFLQSKIKWITDARKGITQEKPLQHGSILSLYGKEHTVVFLDVGPRKVTVFQDGNIHYIKVGGPASHAPKRLVGWLKDLARTHLTEAATAHAETLGVSFNAIRIGDTKSRWGSCSARGNLNFSWRLILAPASVLNYVAAHEVAHLIEMNHSAAFWREVEKCVPNWEMERKWLRKNGGHLMAQARL